MMAERRDLWQVSNRGVRGRPIFVTNHQYFRFLELLEEKTEATGSALAGYTLLPRAYALTIEATLSELSQTMQRVMSRYARLFNDQRRVVGRLCMGPYRAERPPSPVLMAQSQAYMVVQPVKLGLAEDPGAYRWSSLNSLLGKPGSPFGIDGKIVLGRLGGEAAAARRLLLDEIEREAGRPAEYGPCESRFARLLEHVREWWDDSDGIDRLDAALFIGRRCGVPVRAMAKILGERPQRLRQALLRVSKRVARIPNLGTRLQPP